MISRHDNAELGWKQFFSAQLSAEETASCYPARIAQIHRTHAIVWSARGESKIDIGLFKNPSALAVGDWLLLPHDSLRPVRILDRATELARQMSSATGDRQLIAANIDTLFIVSSCNQEFNESRIERYLALAHDANINPVIVLTKQDIADTVDQHRSVIAALSPTTRLECVNAKDAQQVAALKEWCGLGQTVALVGSSGVGKSTLINNLAQANQKTSAIRESDDKGRHTTTFRSLHRLPGGGLLIDSPGIRELQLAECKQGIESTFDDIASLINTCKFRNCRHLEEADCAIQTALQSDELATRRWQSYLRLQTEQNKNAELETHRRDRHRKSSNPKMRQNKYKRK